MSILTVAGTGVGSVVDALLPDSPILRLMIIVSVMTWGRDSDRKKYGWWAIPVSPNIEKDFGSFLWKLSRSKVVTETSALVVTYVENSLQWMKRRGIAEEVYVQALITTEQAWIRVRVVRGDRSVEVFFDNLWNGVK